MCCLPFYLLWWSLAGTMLIGANHWVIVKIHVNGTTKWEDGSNFPPMNNVFTINITTMNNTNMIESWSDSNNLKEFDHWNRDLLIPLNDQVEYITRVNTTMYVPRKPIWYRNHVDEILIGHIVFFAFVDIIAILSIILIGINYVKLWNNNVEMIYDDDI